MSHDEYVRVHLWALEQQFPKAMAGDELAVKHCLEILDRLQTLLGLEEPS